MNLGAGTGQWPSIGRWLKRAAIFCLNEKEIVKDHEFRPEMLGFTRLNLVEKKKLVYVSHNKNVEISAP